MFTAQTKELSTLKGNSGNIDIPENPERGKPKAVKVGAAEKLKEAKAWIT